jgi:nitrogen fixation-related uncharacterized protein
MGLLILILFLAVLGIAAILWGVDSSDAADPRRPVERGVIS